MKLNLGCGNNKFEGWVNADKFKECNPDILLDIEMTPWFYSANLKWDDVFQMQESSVEAIRAFHVLEHIGQRPAVFINVMKEIYRVCKPGAEINIVVPHPRNDNFYSDPTHVRPITPDTMALFSKKHNIIWKEQGHANSPLALYHNVDFDLKSAQVEVTEEYKEMLKAGIIDTDELWRRVKNWNNVATEYHIVLEVVKE